MKKFEIGKKYQTRSACDHDCVFEIAIIKRTEKTVTFKDYENRVRRSKIQIDNEGEYIIPDKYSMAPIYRACREAA